MFRRYGECRTGPTVGGARAWSPTVRPVTEPLPWLFSGPPPDRHAVLQEPVSFNPDHWLDRLPERWMFDRLADLAYRQDWQNTKITRQDVFDLTRTMTTPREAIQGYVAICAWGAGPRARLVGRRVRVLRENKGVGERLLNALANAREDNAVAAYASFQRRGENRLLHLGPAFWTKVLYFGAYDPERGLGPLILDRYVAKALNDIAGFGWPRTWNWSQEHYLDYLDAAWRWSDAWGTQDDVVEWALFERGKSLR